MASLTNHSKGRKLRYRLYFPDGLSVVRFVYRTNPREARALLAHAEKLEALARQNLLTPEIAAPFQHWGLLKPQDLDRYFPHRLGPLTYSDDALLQAYAAYCERMCPSPRTRYNNRLRAEALIARLGSIAQLTERAIAGWQLARAREVAATTVNVEMSVLRCLLDCCVEAGWCVENPARRVRNLPGRAVRFPKALTFAQVRSLLSGETGASPHAGAFARVASQMIVAGIYFGLRRGELLHLMGSDTNGRQVLIQAKTLPDGRTWTPKDKEARSIYYPGIERAIVRVFGESPTRGLLFPSAHDPTQPFHADALSVYMSRRLGAVAPGLTLHSLRHTFATWRLMMGDPLLAVKGMMGHSRMDTLMRYAHVQTDLTQDLLLIL